MDYDRIDRFTPAFNHLVYHRIEREGRKQNKKRRKSIFLRRIFVERKTKHGVR